MWAGITGTTISIKKGEQNMKNTAKNSDISVHVSETRHRLLFKTKQALSTTSHFHTWIYREATEIYKHGKNDMNRRHLNVNDLITSTQKYKYLEV